MTLQFEIRDIASISPEPHLREATFEDYPRIARLSWQNGLYPQAYDDWKRLWTNHPLGRAMHDWPIGWVMEDSARNIVGALMNVPSAYTFHGEQYFCGNGRGWVVAPEYRGYSLWLMDEFMNQPGMDLYIATTVGESATSTWEHLGHRIPVGDWCGARYWITNHRNFMKRALEHKRFPLNRLGSFIGEGMKYSEIFRREAPPTPGGMTVEAQTKFDARFDDFWKQLAANNPGRLLGVRDRTALNWHFATSLRNDDLWIFTASRRGLMRGYCIFKKHAQSQGMSRMRLVDYQSVDEECYLLPGFIQAALKRCEKEEIDLLENVGVGVPKMWAFDLYAPYRRKMQTWPCYYHATNGELASALLYPDPWDPSMFDGDSSFE